MDKGLPLTFAKWLRDFLSNRRARAQINGEQGQPVPPEQGQPLLLSILYINDLKTVVPNGVKVAMFADDVSLLCSHPCKFTAQTAMQGAVTRVAEWSRHHKMTLTPEKCEVAFFTSNLHETRRQPTIHLEGQPLRFIPLPKLLGVTLDRLEERPAY